MLVTGASGLIGTALSRKLRAEGYTVHALSRRDSSAPFYYDQSAGQMRLDPGIPLFAAVNLAGASLADGRWTAKRKQLIMTSRTLTTARLCEALAGLPQPLSALLSASAIGYYGDTGDHVADEGSAAGDTFLAEVASRWEQATVAAQAHDIRTVHLRFGLVLSPAGGVLPNFILPLGLAAVGRVGDGRQYISWISLDDCLAIITRALREPDFSGAINVVSNREVSNDEFTRALARALGRPRLPPLPAFMVKLLFGEMGEEALLASGRVKSRRYDERHIELAYPDLDQALRHLLA